MIIRCDWEKCTDECKYYNQCDLHNPASSQLLAVQWERDFIFRKIQDIDAKLITARKISRDISLGVYHENIKKPSDVHYGLDISLLLQQKEDYFKILGELMRREKNIEYIVNRRKQ